MAKTARFEASDYLATAEARAEYMTAALETGDVRFIRDALETVAKAIGMAKVARQAGITREGLYKVLGPAGNPEFGTVISLLPALRLKLKLKLAARPVRSKRTPVRRAAKRTVRRRA